ncbi:MAG: hypothetical protein DMG79_11885 [Acidobacteria bacterium]|nr:MAG: hypothetical protein DMG79_11885 [Acidobacteriota bacterium]
MSTLSPNFKAVLAVLTLALFAAPAALAQEQEKVLYSFYDSGGLVLPVAGVISDASGNLYGTTFYGGANGVGMVFELSPGTSGWKETVLHSFNVDGTDGFWITGGLVFDAAGNLYGTTEFGGSGLCISGIGGCGMVYKLTPNSNGSWTETILHNFDGNDGFEAHSGLTIDAAGNLYGTTANGGAYSQGTVYEVSPSAGGTWTEKTLHDFTGGADGGVPYGSVLLDAAGNLYGMTSAGGGNTPACRYGCGTVFELSPTLSGNWKWKGLHDFSKRDGDGKYPYNGLIFDASGNLYGVTSGGGGGPHNKGIVFELSPTAGGKWTEKILHNFNIHNADGNGPSGTPVFDASGNLYGVTLGGGSNGKGSTFKLTPTTVGPWTETVLHSFSDQGSDGYHPNAGLIFDASGNLYGTTGDGGQFNEGTVFEITP